MSLLYDAVNGEKLFHQEDNFQKETSPQGHYIKGAIGKFPDMYCENCGKEFSERQKYCTRCGIDTDSGSQVLSTGSFESLLEELHAISYSLERLRPLADSAHILASRITKQLIHRREEILDKFAKALDVTEVVETPERVSYLRDSARSLIGSGEEIDAVSYTHLTLPTKA